MPQQLSTNTFCEAKWLVDPVVGQGTHTTITAAIASASSGDTIFIRASATPYTENPTLKAGVNLTAYVCDAYTPNVTILGKCTFTGAGTVSISGINLKTNSDYCLSVTGSAASIINLQNCNIQCTNNTGINYSSSSASSNITLNDCISNLTTTGIAHFAHSSAGQLSLNYCFFSNSGGSSTANTVSGTGSLAPNWTTISNSITVSGTAQLNGAYNLLNTITYNSTGNPGVLMFSTFTAGSAVALTIGAGASFLLFSCIIDTTNGTTIGGSGNLRFTQLSFNDDTAIAGTLTVTPFFNILGGSLQTPIAGIIGEQIRSYVPKTSPVALSNNTPANITSISLTAGIWDVSAIAMFAGATSGTSITASITTTSATLGIEGDSAVFFPFLSQASVEFGLTIPAYRLTLGATTIVYLVAQEGFTVGSANAFGRISATRVG